MPAIVGISLNVVSGIFGFLPGGLTTSGAVVTVEKPERFCEGFSKQLVEIINQKLPKASDFDFHSLRQFPQRVPARRGMPQTQLGETENDSMSNLDGKADRRS
jgi:hypothetical protein